MRPIAVLILILGAIAALVFAVVSISPTRAENGRRPVVPTRPVGPAESVRHDPTPLERPDQVVDPADPLPTGQDRTVVEYGAATEEAWANQLLGRVITAEGHPVPSAIVSLIEQADTDQLAELGRVLSNKPEPRPKRRTQTDENGAFRFDQVEPGDDYALTVAHAEFARAQQGPIVIPEKGTVEEVVELRRGFQLHGHVRDQTTGKPLAGAELVLDDPVYALLPGPRRRANPRRKLIISDAQGYYFFPNVTPGNKVLTCRLKGYATQIHPQLTFLGEEPERIEKDCVLEPGAIIAGRVIGPDGRGIVGVHIDAISHQEGRACQGTAKTKENGEFVVEDISKGTFIVTASVEGWDVDPVPRVNAGETDLIIQVYAQGAIAGRVAATSGEPVRDFEITVRAFHPSSKAFGHVVTTKPFNGRGDGSFEITGISEGRYVIQASAGGYANSFSDRVTVEQGLTTPDVEVLMTQGGTLRGRVVDVYTKQPVAGAEVSSLDNNWIDSDFTDILGGMSPTGLSKISVKTGGDGSFSVPLMTVGEYQIRISHDSYTQIIQNDVKLNEGRPTDMGRIELSRGAIVTGTVFADDGSRARGVDVFLRPLQGEDGRNVQARTDAQGRYRLPNCAAGTYKLSAARPGGGGNQNPFAAIIDMKKSETRITLKDNQEYAQDLYMGGN